MNLSGLHILLTYKCNYECDHCFVWGSPEQDGIFSLEQLEEVLQQALDLGTIRSIYFEGGEPFLYYPILLGAVERAHQLGFFTGIVTNGYWVESREVAGSMLKPLAHAGLDMLQISNDTLHLGPVTDEETHIGILVAGKLRIQASIINMDPPKSSRDPNSVEPGAPVIGGGIMFRGRAAENLAPDLPRHAWQSFDKCPYEKLDDPARVHLDPFGYLHLCQGIVMGNLFERPLKEIVSTYDPKTHPVVGPLLNGGPAQLVESYLSETETHYVDACQLCYCSRQALRTRFPEELAPDAMYGVPAAHELVGE